MNITRTILQIYPTLTFGKDFNVQDNLDGKGPILTWLSKTIKQPTKAELDKAWLQVQAKEKAELIKKQKKAQIDKLATLSDQLNLLAINLNTVVDILIKTNPTLAKDKDVIQGKKILTGIQTILKPKKIIPKVI